MPAYYSIVQFVPSRVADERINVAVVVYDDQRLVCRTLHHWGRVRTFAGESVEHVRDSVESMLSSDLEPDDILRSAEAGVSTVQFTRPRASLLPADALLDQIAGAALMDREPQRRVHSKNDVIRAGRVALEREASSHLGTGHNLGVVANATIDGKRAGHEADLALKNGRLLLVAQAISFDRSTKRDVQRDVNALAWFLDDLNSVTHPPQRAILVAPPAIAGDRTDYVAGTDLFRELNAKVVLRGEIDAWAREAVIEALH